jgi:hypothetical protein
MMPDYDVGIVNLSTRIAQCMNILIHVPDSLLTIELIEVMTLDIHYNYLLTRNLAIFS